MATTTNHPRLRESAYEPPEDLNLTSKSIHWRNIALLVAAILAWVAVRFLYIRLQLGQRGHFMKWDVAFILLPPILAFVMNWRRLREQPTNTIICYACLWAIIDLVVCALLAIFAAAPLHYYLESIPI